MSSAGRFMSRDRRAADQPTATGPVAFMVQNRLAANILMLFLVLAGLAAATNLVQEVLPDLSLDRVQVLVTYPGATPGEIEESVVRRIEEQIRGVEGLDELAATAPVAAPKLVLQTQDFPNSRHGQPLLSHRLPPLLEGPLRGRKKTSLPKAGQRRYSLSPGWTASVGITGRHPSESVDDMRRNQWTTSIGMGGRHPSESAQAESVHVDAVIASSGGCTSTCG